MARTALVFALLHPFLYQGTPSGGERPWDPTRQLTLTTDFADLATGIVAWLNVGHSPFSMKENPFSMSSAPAAGPNVSFMIKELGDFTRTIGQIKPDTVAYLDGPYGNLTVDGRGEPGIALIAGGVGLSPLLDILRQMRLTGDWRKVKVVYGNRIAEQVAYHEELGDEDVASVYLFGKPGQIHYCGYLGKLARFSEDILFSHSASSPGAGKFDIEAMSYPETLDLQVCEPNNDRNAPGISERWYNLSRSSLHA